MMSSNENTTTTTRLSILKSFNNKEEDIQQQQQQQQSQQTQSSTNHRNHSIITRNLRLNNGHQSQLLNSPQKISIINNLQHSTTTNHNLTSSTTTIINNKTGFTDLSFIDFSCINFPRIAQNYCELWPRKASLNSPLHNYTCNKCSHSFPCPSSLKLHSENDVNCKLLLNNLNKIVYKTIDDLIKQIEYETEFEDDNNKINYLKQFGLIEKEELKRKEDKRLKLRDKLIDINYQFIIDLDKWKLQQHHNNQATYKVLLKPNVNLNRPLLIRSKKIKRIKSFSYLKQQQQQQQLNNKDDEQKQSSSTYRIVRIARSNSTSSSSTTTTTQLNENNKRPIININNNSKRVKRQQQDQQKPTTNVDSISFKKILTISNELILNKNKTSPSLPPPPPTLFKLTDQQNNNKKVFEMPKLQPISSLSSSTTTTTTNNKQQHQQKLKSIINENVSLKCKFCPNIFKGQSKFLQHVINSHPELIRERFNRHQQNNSSSNSGIKVKVN
jgi:hypothetical protein